MDVDVEPGAFCRRSGPVFGSGDKEPLSWTRNPTEAGPMTLIPLQPQIFKGVWRRPWDPGRWLERSRVRGPF